jgi:type II secretion system protein C
MTRLLRASVWALNGLLIALCAYWTAAFLLAAAGTLITSSGAVGHDTAVAAPTERPTWQERRVILDKNLFQVSTLLPDDFVPDDQIRADLEETKLPLSLIGTVASSLREEARASVRIDREGRVVTVRIGEEVIDGATVSRIERRRVVLENRGSLEALSLDDDNARPLQASRGLAPTRPTDARRGPPRQGRATATTRRRPPIDAAALRDPAQIASQARFLPRYEDGTGKILGIQVDAVRSGSLLEDIGMRDGDTIVEFNGLEIAGAEDASELLSELAEVEEFEVQVVGRDGTRRTLEYLDE